MKAFLNGIACLAGLVFCISQIITGGWFWASIVYVGVMAIYFIFYFFFGGIASIVFCFIFIAMTVSMSNFNVRNEAVGTWLKQHPEEQAEFNNGISIYTPQEKKQFTAVEFQDKLRDNWLSSDDSRYWSWQKHTDTDAAFPAAYADFEKWVLDGADPRTLAPVPSVGFMNHYCETNHYRFPDKSSN
jgi:hypothetical protein